MMKTFNKNICLALVGIVLISLSLAACRSDKNPSQSEKTTTVLKDPVPVPSMNKDSAFAYVERQVSFGTRVVGSEGHQACKEWLVSKLESWNIEVTEQDFTAELYTGNTPKATNIIGRINPSHPRRILLAAHWDTRHIADQDPDDSRQNEPILGADDGGSGVAVLLEIARIIQQNPVDLGIDIVFFDAEDHGQSEGADYTSWCLGSQYWSRNRAGTKPEYGILLDMVGAKGAIFRRDGISRQHASHVLEKVWNMASRMGYGKYFLKEDLPGFTDDHRFVNEIARIPMIDICNRSVRGFGTHWHTHADNLKIIDRSVLRVVGQVVLAVIYKESTGHI